MWSWPLATIAAEDRGKGDLGVGSRFRGVVFCRDVSALERGLSREFLYAEGDGDMVKERESVRGLKEPPPGLE